MEQLESAIGRLEELHQLGVGLSIDDFGTGYSSLSHLSSLPLDCLKIDRSFVRNLEADSKEAAVIRAIVLLGTSLGKQVIAEGIETTAQRDELRALGCDIGQGYLFARPMAAGMIDELLASTLRDRAAEAATPIRNMARRRGARPTPVPSAGLRWLIRPRPIRPISCSDRSDRARPARTAAARREVRSIDGWRSGPTSRVRTGAPAAVTRAARLTPATAARCLRRW